MGEIEEAIKMYHRQLALARSNRDRAMEAAACGALGIAHRLLKKLDKALGISPIRMFILILQKIFNV